MSVLSRSALMISLIRYTRRQQRFSCAETLNLIKSAQFTASRGRDVRSYSVRYLANCGAKQPWTLYQRRLYSEAPSKDDEYPPLPEYTPNTENPQAKEVFLVQARGLPWSCTVEDIMSFFSVCRIRGGVQGVHIIYNRYGKSTGQAFIELEQEEDVSKALEQHKHYLGERYIEVSEITNKEAEAILESTKPIMVSDGVVRLRGLPYSSTEEDIIEFFPGLQIVENGVTIIMNRRGRSTGDAFVEFATKEMAEKALQKHKEVMGNRYIEIFPSRKSEVLTQYKRQQKEMPAVTPGAEDTTHTTQTTAPYRTPTVSATQNFIHMRGLPYNARGDDIVKFFAPIRLSRFLIEYDPSGRPTGVDVYFTTHEDAVLAMSKDKEYLMDRYIELFLNSTTSRDQ